MQKDLSKLAKAVEKGDTMEHAMQSRRIWLQNAGLVAGSGAMMWACGSKSSDDAGAAEMPKTDGDYINAALALEHEAISIYTTAATLDPLTKTTTYSALKDIAVAFLADHKAHRDALIAAITYLKTMDSSVADAVAAKSDADYVTKLKTDYSSNIVTQLSGSSSDSYKSGMVNILRLAAQKEMAAAKAYLSLVSNFTCKLADGSKLSDVDGALAVEEAAHFGVLRAGLFAVLGDTTSVASGSVVVPGSLPGSWTTTKDPS